MSRAGTATPLSPPSRAVPGYIGTDPDDPLRKAVEQCQYCIEAMADANVQRRLRGGWAMVVPVGVLVASRLQDPPQTLLLIPGGH